MSNDSSVTIKMAVKGETDVIQSVKRVEREFKDTQKALLAVASGFGIATLISKFSASMSEAVSTANRFGLISQSNTVILAKYTTATKELEMAKAKLAVEIAGVLAPALTSVVHTTSDIVSGFGNLVSTSDSARTAVLGLTGAVTAFGVAFSASKLAALLGAGSASGLLGKIGLGVGTAIGGYQGGKAIGKIQDSRGSSVHDKLAAAMLNIQAHIELLSMPTAASRDRINMLEKEMADLMFPKKGSAADAEPAGLISKEDLDLKMRMIQLQIEENNQLAERNMIGLEGSKLDKAQVEQLEQVKPLIAEQVKLVGTAYNQKLITVNEKLEYELQLSGQLLNIDKERAKFTLTPLQTYKAQTEELDRRIKVIQSTPGIGQMQKDAESLAIVQSALLANEKALTDLRKNAPNAEIIVNQDGTLQYSKAYSDYLDQENKLLREQADLRSKSKDLDRGSITGQLAKGWDDFSNQIGTTAEIIRRAFTSILNSSVNSLAAGIRGLIDGTMKWGKALQTIELGIVNGIIDAIAKMAAEWIVTHVIMESVSWAWVQVRSAMAWAAAGEENAAELSKTPGLATNATLSSISSWGVGAWIGVAALVAALGVGIAAAAGAFESGGYTGPGASSMPAGIVHKNEFVMPSHVVDSVGLPALEAIKANSSIPSSPGASAMGPVYYALFDDRAKMKDWVQSKQGEQVIIQELGRKGYRRG